MNTFLYPYNVGSQSAKALAQGLGIKRIKHNGPLKIVDTLINWGASAFKREIRAFEYVNPPEAVALATNKLKTFRMLFGAVKTPDYTTSNIIADAWLGRGITVVARHTLTGHSGEGIEIWKPARKDVFLDAKEAPLYTAYVPKDEEYRVHVFRGNSFFVQRKARKKDVPDDQVNWMIRNHGNGFIFAHKDIEINKERDAAAITAVETLGLDFGAVDIMLGKDGQWYVLEVNTACGLEGTTLDKYVEQLKEVK